MTEQKRSIRVLVVDDHTIVRKGIKALLAETNGVFYPGRSLYEGSTIVMKYSSGDPDREQFCAHLQADD